MGTDKKVRLFGIMGLAGSGKSTLAKVLEDSYDFKRGRFASTMKGMLYTLLLQSGLSPAKANRMVDGDLKDTPCDELCGKSPRFALQTLGTEWGRELMDYNIWVKIKMSWALKELKRGKSVVLDDVRFKNEGDAIKEAGGLVIKIVRNPSLEPHAYNHCSEGLDYPYDILIDNNGSIDQLMAQIENLVK